MFPKNILSSVCTDLTLEKAKENLKEECKLITQKDSPLKNNLNDKINDEESINNGTVLKETFASSFTENENSDDEELRKWREKKLQELKKKAELKKDGVYLEITEKDFLPTVLKSDCVVCHFYEQNFKRCEILDKHLIRLANIHLTTKFIKVEAKNCPFFIDKLHIKVLPSLVLFIGGVAVHTSIGFEDFGNRDDFRTKDLEKFLYKMKLLRTMEYSEDEEEISDDKYF